MKTRVWSLSKNEWGRKPSKSPILKAWRSKVVKIEKLDYLHYFVNNTSQSQTPPHDHEGQHKTLAILLIEIEGGRPYNGDKELNPIHQHTRHDCSPPIILSWWRVPSRLMIVTLGHAIAMKTWCTRYQLLLQLKFLTSRSLNKPTRFVWNTIE